METPTMDENEKRECPNCIGMGEFMGAHGGAVKCSLCEGTGKVPCAFAPEESESEIDTVNQEYPTCPECGHKEEDWDHQLTGLSGIEEPVTCAKCGAAYTCAMFTEVTFTSRKVEAQRT